MTLDLIVYRQAKKEREDRVIYKGEDARPLVLKNALLVADGLGGAASIRHQEFNREMFDEEKLCEALFHGIYNNYGKEFSDYVKSSFSEFLSIRDCYFDNIFNIKKSGYFASRIVSSIFCHEMLYSKAFGISEGTIFNNYFLLSTEGEKEKFREKLGEYFAKVIGENLKKVARNANLYYESSYEGLALLGTTFCGTIFSENEDSVDAFYLTAGDSRPYLWNAEGLHQVVEDEEGDDGGMTNYIKANDGAKFQINCVYHRFSKPCVLFNATDGCFDSKYFLSQLSFELTLLDAIVASNSMEEVGRALESAFEELGKHDDSSTIALKAFGYGSFMQLKESAKVRRAKILADCGSEEFLSHDFEQENKDVEDTYETAVKDVKEELIVEQAVVSYCRNKMEMDCFQPYLERIRSIDNELAAIREKLQSFRKELKRKIRDNFCFLCKEAHATYASCKDYEKDYLAALAYKNAFLNSVNLYYSEIEKFKGIINTDEHMRLIESVKSSLNRALDFLSCANIYDMASYGKFEVDPNIERDLEETERLMEGLKEASYFVGTFVPDKTGKASNIKLRAMDRARTALYDSQHFPQYEKLYDLSRRSKDSEADKRTRLAKDYYVLDYENDVEIIQNAILDGTLDLDGSDLLKGDINEIKQLVKSYQENLTKYEWGSREGKAQALSEMLPIYWERAHLEIISEIAQGKVSGLPNQLISEIMATVGELEHKRLDILEKSKLQKEIFARFDRVYYSLIRKEATK